MPVAPTYDATMYVLPGPTPDTVAADAPTEATLATFGAREIHDIETPGMAFVTDALTMEVPPTASPSVAADSVIFDASGALPPRNAVLSRRSAVFAGSPTTRAELA